ncbi:DUF1189 family protein [Aerococcaceae bacterium WGS1372]
MKKIFNLLRLGLKNPRYYIESINLHWRQVNFVALLSILMMTISMFANIIPVFSRIADDFQTAINYVPDFTYNKGQLSLNEREKPLYYQSDNLKIVIDETVSTTTNYGSGIPEKQRNILESNSPIGIYLIKDFVFITIGQTAQEVPAYDYLFANNHRFKLFLKYIAEESFSINSMVFIILFITSSLIYWFQMLLISMLAGFFNVRLTRAITFKSRLKLTIIISFVPIILLELTSIIIPGFVVTQFTLVMITLFILYLSFKNHTEFIHAIMNNLDDLNITKNLNDTKPKQDKSKEDKYKDKQNNKE